MKNPNAVVAWLTGLCATGALWLSAKLGWHLSTQTAALVAGTVVTHTAAVILWIGRNGLKAALVRVRDAVLYGWNGPGKK